jgi:hypothetical protein
VVEKLSNKARNAPTGLYFTTYTNKRIILSTNASVETVSITGNESDFSQIEDLVIVVKIF